MGGGAPDRVAPPCHHRCRRGRDEAEFFARLQAENMLVRKRFKDGETGEVTGYAVAVPASYVILRFPEPTDPDVVYLENFTSGLYVEEQEEIARYTLACDHLEAMALSPGSRRN
jgi:hypothetical protein